MTHFLDNAPPTSPPLVYHNKKTAFMMHSDYSCTSGGKATLFQLPPGRVNSTSHLSKSLPVKLFQLRRCLPLLPDPPLSTFRLPSPSVNSGRSGGETSAAATLGFKPSRSSAQARPGRVRREVLALLEERHQGEHPALGESRRRRHKRRSRRGSA